MQTCQTIKIQQKPKVSKESKDGKVFPVSYFSITFQTNIENKNLPTNYFLEYRSFLNILNILKLHMALKVHAEKLLINIRFFLKYSNRYFYKGIDF